MNLINKGFGIDEIPKILNCLYKFKVNKLVIENYNYYSVLYVELIDGYGRQRILTLTKLLWKKLELNNYCLTINPKLNYSCEELGNIFIKIDSLFCKDSENSFQELVRLN